MRKVRISSESGEKYAQIKQRLQAKTVLHKFVGGFEMKWQQEMDFFTGGSVTTNGLIVWPETMVWSKKCLNDWFVSYKHAAFVFSRH